MYTYRKPKNAEQAIELIRRANPDPNPRWDISNPNDIVKSQRYFEMYQPILFIYMNENLIGSAHNKNGGRPTIIGLDDKDITNQFSKSMLAEVDVLLRQLELF